MKNSFFLRLFPFVVIFGCYTIAHFWYTQFFAILSLILYILNIALQYKRIIKIKEFAINDSMKRKFASARRATFYSDFCFMLFLFDFGGVLSRFTKTSITFINGEINPRMTVTLELIMFILFILDVNRSYELEGKIKNEFELLSLSGKNKNTLGI